MPKPLITAVNAMREAIIENDHLHHQELPILDSEADLPAYGAQINAYTSTQNAFMDVLMNRIVFTSIIQNNDFGNELRILRGERIPLGYAGQEIYTNPALGQGFNDEDYLGLLQKYEADVKVQYLNVNKENQYPVSIGRNRLEQAFVSYDAFESFIGSIIDSLYKGFYIDDYNYVKGLVSAAYRNNHAMVEVVSDVTTTQTAQDFLKTARKLYFKFTKPSSKYNAWAKVGGSGNPVTTWVAPENIVFLMTADVRAELDVDYLASVFNIDRAEMLGRVIVVDDFNVYDRKTGGLVYDGSAIKGIMADKRWFKIREQRLQLDQFYNAKNMVWNYFLQAFMMYQYSLFANAVIFATTAPTVDTTGLSIVGGNTVSVAQGGTTNITVQVTPNGSTQDVTYTKASGVPAGLTVTANPNNSREATIAVASTVDAGNYQITVKSGTITTNLQVTVTEA